MTNYKQKYDKLKEGFEQYQKESIKWSVEDFTEMDEDYEISEDEAQEALEEMIRRHDANHGITWDTVRYYLTQYGKKKQL